MHLLQVDSIKYLYQSRLNRLIEHTETNEEVEKGWENIMHYIKMAANEAVAKKNKIIMGGG